MNLKGGGGSCSFHSKHVTGVHRGNGWCFYSSARLVPTAHHTGGHLGKTVCISSIKHQTHATEVRQREVLQPSLSLGGHPEDPQAQCDCAHFRGEDTKAQGRSAVPQLAVKTAQPVAWSRTRGREDVTSGQTELSQRPSASWQVQELLCSSRSASAKCSSQAAVRIR